MKKNFSYLLVDWYEKFIDYYKQQKQYDQIPNLKKMKLELEVWRSTTTVIIDIMQLFWETNEFPIKINDFEFIDDINWRWKSEPAIEEKFNRKVINTNSNIEYKKIFNDLCGFRIIINISIKEFEKLIDEEMFYIVKHPKPNKSEEYVALHLYLYRRRFPLKKENLSRIPWIEIQIWEKQNAEKNTELHVDYKGNLKIRDIF